MLSLWWKKLPGLVERLGRKHLKKAPRSRDGEGVFCLGRDRAKNEVKIQTSALFSAFVSPCGLGRLATLSFFVGLTVGLVISGAESAGNEVAIGFSDAPCDRCWRASEGVWWPMKAPKCFLLRGSFSTKPGSKGLGDGLPITPWHKPNCFELPQPRNPRHCRRLQILTRTSPHPFDFSWCCFSQAMTLEKHHKFSTFLVAQFCRLACRLGAAYEKAQKIWLWASDFVWSWCICGLTKLGRRECSF